MFSFCDCDWHSRATVGSAQQQPLCHEPFRWVPPGCYYQIKTSGFKGSEPRQVSQKTQRVRASCVRQEHTSCTFMRALSGAVMKPRPHQWLLYSQLQARAAGVGVGINRLKGRTVRCSSHNDPRKSLSVSRHAALFALRHRVSFLLTFIPGQHLL